MTASGSGDAADPARAERAGTPLGALHFLVGAWRLEITNASFLEDPGHRATGRMVGEAIESGRLLVLRQHTEASAPPLASWVIGRDAARASYTVLYTDERDVARVYEMTLEEDRWAIWRDDPAFAQRFEATVSPNRSRIEGRWERRVPGGPWEHDFEVTYTREPLVGRDPNGTAHPQVGGLTP